MWHRATELQSFIKHLPVGRISLTEILLLWDEFDIYFVEQKTLVHAV
jgi:hypothetical protein